jgi:Putative abortive phage resistance protein AbiGi, antitoxin
MPAPEVSYPQSSGENAVLEANASKSRREAYLGETLYHFIGKSSDDDLMYIFDSIARRGLLMTIGDKNGNLDRFFVEAAGNTVAPYEIMQKARVCFTDIPKSKLQDQSGEYGKFGIGFSRKTIISWGGNPVLYVPNHLDGPVTLVMGGLLHGLFKAASGIDILQHYCSGGLNNMIAPNTMGADDIPLLFNGEALRGENRRAYLNLGRDSIEHLLALVKQMSHNESNDYSYLYEREWRIVTGISINGKALARKLTPDEKAELCGKRNRWRRPLELREKPLYYQEHGAMIDLFRMFNGFGDTTVAKGITDIVVPDGGIKERVVDYIAEHPHMFAGPAPEVSILEF